SSKSSTDRKATVLSTSKWRESWTPSEADGCRSRSTGCGSSVTASIRTDGYNPAMRKLMLWTVAVVALSAGVAQAQELTGNWQGTLQAGGRELRIVFKIANEAGGPKAVMYSIDQGGQGMAASAVGVQGTAVNIS